MKRSFAILLLLPVLVLAKCAWVRTDHNMAAKNLQRRLSGVTLPAQTRILEEKSEVGGFISGTGDAIDILAFRVFASDLPESTILQTFASWTGQTPTDDVLGIFRLDSPEPPQSHGPEWYLRRAIPPTTGPAYVIYSAERIDDGVWDWRGW